MTFWPLTNSDFLTDQTFHQFHDLNTELGLHRIMSDFHGALKRVWLASRERLPFRTFSSFPFFWDLLVLNFDTRFLEIAMCYSTFHLEYPSVLSRFWCLSHYWEWFTVISIRNSGYSALKFPIIHLLKRLIKVETWCLKSAKNKLKPKGVVW